MKLSWVIRTLVLLFVLVAVGVVMSQLLVAETPYGEVNGRLLTKDKKTPLTGIEVTLVTNIDPRPEYYKGYVRPWYFGMDGTVARATTDAEGRFTFHHVKQGDYRVVARTFAHKQVDGKVFTVKEGSPTSVVCHLDPVAPFINLFQNQRVVTTKEVAQIRCHGFVGTNALTLRIYHVSTRTAVEEWHGWLPTQLERRTRDYTAKEVAALPGLTALPARKVNISKRDTEGIFREEVKLGKLSPGAYLLDFISQKTHRLGYLVVSDLGMVVKMWGDHGLAYTTDLESGAPRPNVAISVWQGTHKVSDERTGDGGFTPFTVKREQGENMFTVVGEAGDSLAIADLYAYTWDDTANRRRVYTYTDRPVYRPGHTVYFKSIVRDLVAESDTTKESADYQVPSPLTAKIRVTDGNDDVIYTGETTTNAFGSLNGSFPLDEAALPGWYTLSINLDGRSYDEGFSVAEYRKPEYEVTVKMGQPRYTRGDTLSATVSAQYYYGAPVPNAHFSYYITRDPQWYGDCCCCDSWDEDLTADSNDGYESSGGGNDYGGGEVVVEGSGRLDNNGSFVINWASITGEKAKKKSADEPIDWEPDYDSMDYRFTLHATVTDASDRSEEGQSGALVTQGAFRISTAPSDYVVAPGEKTTVNVMVSDYNGKPLPKISGTATLTRREWSRDGKAVDTLETTVPWTTDITGAALVPVTPSRAGTYRFNAMAQDDGGHHLANSTDLWVQKYDAEEFTYPYQDLQVRADKTLYHEGETATILINTRYGGNVADTGKPQMAFFTIEGVGVLQQRAIALKGKSPLISVPITADLTPSAFASVCFIRDKQMHSGTVQLNVSREKKALKVQITADKQTYLPGEHAHYTVKTTDPAGKPVQAEVSLGLVDEALYAIAQDSTEHIVSFFYPKRWNQVDTAFSFPDIYLSGDDKAGSTIKTRKNFQDTAFWEASTVTGPDGTATFDVTLPDNLTTWRATCRGATMDTRVGETTQQVIVNKPFLVRLETPRFLTQEDKAEIAVVAHNLTDHAVDAEVGLNAGGLEINNPGTQKQHLEAGQTARFEWQVAATTFGDVTPRAWGRAGGNEDAMQLTLPVRARGRTHAVVKTGALDGEKDLDFTVDAACISGSQQLKLRLSPSIASAMLGSLDYLAQYPYGCVEQTMSCFIPDVQMVRILDRLGVANEPLRASVPKMVRTGLFKLYGFQQSDGSWGWWYANDNDYWMSAYVMFGLHEAREAGYDVNQVVIDRGLDALRKDTEHPEKMRSDERALVAYVLALYGQRTDAAKLLDGFANQVCTGKVRNISDWGRATLARALALTGDHAKAQTLLLQLWSRFTLDSYIPLTGTYNAKEGSARSQWWGRGEYAAALLTATCEIQPDHPRLPSLVQWIVANRQNGYWESTRGTASTIYGLSLYLERSQELNPDMDVTVAVNGRTTLTRHFTAADINREEVVVKLKPTDLPPGKVVIHLTKAGTGRLYYTAQLTQIVKEDLNVVPPGTPGLSVTRHYELLAHRNESPRSNSAAKYVTAFRAGDIIRTRLTVKAEKVYEYLMLEDPLPAGFEPQDHGSVDPWEWESYGWWWSANIIRDHETCFAIHHLASGEQELAYLSVAQTPGTFTAMPPVLYDMYNSEVHCEGVANTITVSP
jgi:alpha-2-macroglobulin